MKKNPQAREVFPRTSKVMHKSYRPDAVFGSAHNKKRIRKFIVEIIAILIVLALFGIPFSYALLNSAKTRTEAASMNLSLPSDFVASENYQTAITTSNNMVIRGFFNSVIITTVSIVLLVLLCSMGGYVLQRRRGRTTTITNLLLLAGLMLPPAIMPTYYVMNAFGIYGGLFGMIMVEVALNIPFTLMLFRAFMAGIPREIDEAAFIDGCGKFRHFFSIIFPLLKPVTATVIVLSAVGIFNDFVNPLYFLPGAQNVTVQLTMYNYIGRYASSWNLLFANVVLISLPPLILFIIFSKRIVSGMVAGSIKG